MNRLIPIMLTVILLFTASCAFSRVIWKTYTRANGLAGDSVYCIAQDKLGNMWFGSRKSGLSKIDTNGFIINFIDSIGSITSILDIEIDSCNNKWLTVADYSDFGTYVVKYDDSTFTYYSPVGDPKYDPKPICLGQDSSGHIWCGTTTGAAYWFDGVEWHPVQIIPGLSWCFINEIKQDRLGDLYFDHDQGIIAIIDGRFTWLWGGPEGWYIWRVHDLAFDKQNRLWFPMLSDTRGGLGSFDGTNWNIWSESDGLLDNDVWAVAIDSSNNVWISYATSPPYLGVSKYNGLKFTCFNHKQGLAYDAVWDIYVDKKGQIWFGTRGGVSVLQDTMTTAINQKKAYPDSKQIFNLFQNYPNPFNSLTAIRYNLIYEGTVELSIYNLTGKEVIKLVSEKQSPGEYVVLWKRQDKRGGDVPSGIYFYQLRAGSFVQTKKALFIK